ncbi:sigma-70 family RNA polymerase sigma factor [Rhodoblastus acidophilus]|uniref:Sigma-70 family RNA polymerase sigma factor n=1 Tax=Rhodoblastus acidophilus TaxID=1074 RepID=A0A6N8DMF4_RHOAC|nr:sigma-70 family RNA polymerase sigma factor [Rhodoblastus acidophilus]MCW2273794.1 RNA polymerase sigma-70 factor (ECF subfamily) [Rhodoblastus acidophilus]MTV31056.1 sigma-70 family RNA polymerase sigma factor [Rhodoblastus acidophilus]
MPDWISQDHEWSADMRAALAGDGVAYKRLLTALTPFLRRICMKACARAGMPASDVEDAVQETLLALHLKRHTWDATQPLTPWLAAIARNKMIDAARRRGRRVETDIADFENVLAAPGADAFERELDRQDALRLLDQLSAKQREAIEAVSIRGESLRDAARTLGVSEGALRVSVHRGLKSLADLYRKATER